MAQLAPCVISKAKLALGLPVRYRGNSKHFSKNYWEKVVRELAAEERNISAEKIRETIDQCEYYLNLGPWQPST